MGAKTFLRVIGVALILGNLVAIGRYDLAPLSAGLMTFGVAAAIEIAARMMKTPEDAGSRSLLGLSGAAALTLAGLYVPPDNADRQSNIIARRVFVCPVGYVAHPVDPDKCVVPLVVAQPVEIVDPFKEASTQPPPVATPLIDATTGRPFIPAPGEIERVNAAIRADYEHRQAMLESIRQSRRDEEPAYTWQQRDRYAEQAPPTYAAPVYPRTYTDADEGSQPSHVYSATPQDPPQDPPRIRAIDNGYGTTFRDQNGVRYRAEAIPGTSDVRLNDAKGQQVAKCVDAGFGNLRCR